MDQLSERIRNKSNGRQVRLRVYLLEHGIEVKGLAAKRGLTPGAMGDVLSGRRPKREHIDWLVGQGIPAELLPEPVVPQKRGRKSKEAQLA